jgi:hypothetical protein
VALLLALPAQAAAQAPAQLKLKVDARALSGESWKGSGSIVPPEPVQVRVSRRGKLLQTRTVVPDAKGRFALRLKGRRPGAYRVVAMHPATAQLAYARSSRRRVTVHRPTAGPGARGFVVRKLQTRLKAAGYVIGAPGVFDARTGRAVLAFRKNSGLPRTSYASEAVFRRLSNGGGRYRVRYRGHGRHVEASLSKQVMALIGAGGTVERIYPISSGSPFTPTITGNFAVYRRDFGTNILGMIHASYFRGGYAIHGYTSVPIYPASHGCLRVPPDDALSVFNWIRYGTRVDVYR